MSFTITLCSNFSEKNCINKTITDGISMTGDLKANCSVTNPTILVESTGNLSTYNYLKIPQFGRSYFVTDIVSVGKNLWEINAHCDVLTSFKNDILLTDAIIERQASVNNALLFDSELLTYQNTNVGVITFPSGFDDAHNRSYVLVTAG